MQSLNGPPPIVGPTGGSVADVTNVVKSMQAMISNIMSEHIDKKVINEITRHIKIFMCLYEMMDCNIRQNEKKKKFTWISCYNFVCLLNIARQVCEFGSVFHHWEGSGMGEKFVQVAKRHFHSFRKNWHYNLIQRIVRYNTMSILSCGDVENHDMPDEFHWPNKGVNKMMSIHLYKCTSIPIRDLAQNKPIAFIESENEEFIINVASKMHLKLTIDSYQEEVCSLFYFSWKIDENLFTKDFIIRRSCILLPMLSKSGLVKGCRNKHTGSVYTAIAHDYTEMDESGHFAKHLMQKSDLT